MSEKSQLYIGRLEHTGSPTLVEHTAVLEQEINCKEEFCWIGKHIMIRVFKCQCLRRDHEQTHTYQQVSRTTKGQPIYCPRR